MSIIDKIRQLPSNNPIDIVDIIVNNGYNVNKGLVYVHDDDTIAKQIPKMTDPEQGMNRVNSVVPGFIKGYKVLNAQQIVLYLKRFYGETPLKQGVVVDKEHAKKILQACFDFMKKAKPYVMNDFCGGNILVNNDDIIIIDLDQIFDGDNDNNTSDDYYRRMNWLHNWMTLDEFTVEWNKNF